MLINVIKKKEKLKRKGIIFMPNINFFYIFENNNNDE